MQMWVALTGSFWPMWNMRNSEQCLIKCVFTESSLFCVSDKSRLTCLNDFIFLPVHFDEQSCTFDAEKYQNLFLKTSWYNRSQPYSPLQDQREDCRTEPGLCHFICDAADVLLWTVIMHDIFTQSCIVISATLSFRWLEEQNALLM